MTTFRPETTIPMDRMHMLEQSTGRFQTVKDGLPEIVKNSKDQYSRLGIFDKEKRQIAVIVSPDMTRLGVLDFGGATPRDFEQWKVWSSRDASRANLSQDIEGAHGNGGKSFMVRGSVSESYMCSSVNGRITKMGFKNDTPRLRYKPGKYGNDEGQNIYNLPDPDVENTLNSELDPFGISVEDLPEAARCVFRERHAFTLVCIDGVADWHSRRPETRRTQVRHIPEDLQIHAQAALTIESCSVWVMHGRQLLHEGTLQVQEPEPYPGFENIPRVPIPDFLEDSETSDQVSTGPDGADKKYLEIKTSVQSLRLSDRTKPRNVLRIRNERNIIANYSIADLVPITTSGFLYGTLMVPALGMEHCTGIERQILADTPLVRALTHWAAEKICDVAIQIQNAQSGRDSPLERERASDTLGQLRELMRRFLNPVNGTGETPPPIEFGAVIHEIVLEETGGMLGFPLNTTIPLIFKAYEIRGEDRLPVPSPNLLLESEPEGVVCLVGRGSITGLRQGTCQIRLTTWDRGVSSNPVTVEVLDVERLRLEPPATPLKQGERRKIGIVAYTRSGEQVDDAVYQATVDELSMGRIGRSGFFTAGRVAGTATVRVYYGTDDHETCLVQISDERIEQDRRQRGGPDIPYLILCGETAPGHEHLPEEQRTHPGGPEYTTIIDQDPIWQNIVWINQKSKESEKARGRTRTGGLRGLHTRTFQQFLALKAFEVLRRLRAMQEIGEREVTGIEFLRDLAQAEIDTADFLDEAYELVDRMLAGVAEQEV